MECMGCILRYGCLKICEIHPDDVLKPPCGKFAIGISTVMVFWTIPVDEWLKDPKDKNPKGLKFVELR